MTRSTRGLEVAFVAAFACSLYLHAAIASLGDDYQPGIVSVRLWTDPRLLLLGVTGLLCWAALSPGRRAFAGFARRTLVWTFALCLAIGAGIWLTGRLGLRCGAWAPPGRGLPETLRYSLLCPSFSLRSYGAPYQSALLSAGLWVFSRYLSRADTRGGGADATPSRTHELWAAAACVVFLGGAPNVGNLGFAVFALGWTGDFHGPSSFLLLPFAGPAVGLACQVVFFPVTLLALRLHARIWIAPLLVAGATLLAVLGVVAPARGALAGTLAGAVLALPLAAGLLLQLAALRGGASTQDAARERTLGIE
jgi:hypothetical protein